MLHYFMLYLAINQSINQPINQSSIISHYSLAVQMFSGCCAPGDEPGESVRQLSDMLQDQQACKLLRRVSECLKHLKTLADFRKKYENLAEQLTPNSQPSPEFVFLRLVQFLSDTE